MKIILQLSSNTHFICSTGSSQIWAATWQNQQNGCTSSEDSDQPWHLPSLIRVFAVRMKKLWVLSYPLSTQWRLIRLGGCPGWSESSLGAHSFCWFCHVVAHLTLLPTFEASDSWQSIQSWGSLLSLHAWESWLPGASVQTWQTLEPSLTLLTCNKVKNKCYFIRLYFDSLLISMILCSLLVLQLQRLKLAIYRFSSWIFCEQWMNSQNRNIINDAFSGGTCSLVPCKQMDLSSNSSKKSKF